MKQIIKTLRLSIDNRKQLADAIVDARLLEKKNTLKKSNQQSIDKLVAHYWAAYNLDEESVNKFNEGVLPTLSAFNVYNESGTHLLESDQEYSVPFEVHTLCKESYLKHIGEPLRSELNAAVEQRNAFESERHKAHQTLMNFLDEFASPARLLEKAPDFEAYMPDDWFEETDKELVSINDLLAA